MHTLPLQPDSACQAQPFRILACCRQWYACITSEHYFPSVLALYGRADQTDCMGHAVAADWSSLTVHPKIYAEEEVTASLCAPFGGCHPSTRIDSALSSQT